MSEEPPDTQTSYQPTALREPKQAPREVRYGVAVEYHRPKQDGWEESWEYGMTAGPFPKEVTALEIVPEFNDKQNVVVRFNADGTDEVRWRWDNASNQWLREYPKFKLLEKHRRARPL